MGINFGKFIENRIVNIRSMDSFAFALAIGTGSWIAPISPAVIFGYSLWRSAPEDMGEFRAITAVTVAVGLIVAGAVSSHNAVISKSVKSWLLVIAYILLEIFGLWLMSVTFDVKVVGTVASLLTLVVYLSRTNASEIDAQKENDRALLVTESERAQDELDFQREQVKLDAAHTREQESVIAGQKHAERLARIEVKNSDRKTAKPQNLLAAKPQNEAAKLAAKPQNPTANGRDAAVSAALSEANTSKKSKIATRQDAVLQHMQDGKTTSEIAEMLFVSPDTIRRDTKKINGRTEV